MDSLESGQESAGSMEEVTELVATAGLMFTLSTSIVSCLESKVADPKLLVPIPIFIILLLFLIVTLPISGGHMSPIITFIAALKGAITFARAAVYVLAQCVGSIIGFAVVKIVMGQEAAQRFSLGGCVVDATGSQGLSPEVALTLEFSCTFVFLFISITVAFDEKRCKELGLNLVCVMLAGVAAVVMFISIVITGEPGYAGVGLNPARCLGPAILHGGPLWNGHWVFWDEVEVLAAYR
ncbi:Major intrinsic protein [Dillenia turbinata]|uniref:Major intrinsic protein n=1 Tax=Dillenia turbinata TaxID=194707 RepID=A0AAN8YXM4_9MAGN